MISPHLYNTTDIDFTFTFRPRKEYNSFCVRFLIVFKKRGSIGRIFFYFHNFLFIFYTKFQEIKIKGEFPFALCVTGPTGSCNLGYIFLVLFVSVNMTETKRTRKIYPILHSAPCDNQYLFHWMSSLVYSTFLPLLNIQLSNAEFLRNNRLKNACRILVKKYVAFVIPPCKGMIMQFDRYSQNS